MPLGFFHIERGLGLDNLVQYLQGSGSPGVAGDTAAALVGSVYTDNSTGAIWTKIVNGVGTDRWQRLASETFANNAASVIPDGTTFLSFVNGKLASVACPDGSSTTLTWLGELLQSVNTTRAGRTRTRTLTWSGGALQSVNTITAP